jgi:hypothetical protein
MKLYVILIDSVKKKKKKKIEIWINNKILDFNFFICKNYNYYKFLIKTKFKINFLYYLISNRIFFAN